MLPAFRSLESISGASPAEKIAESTAIDSDVVVILAVLLCGVICVVGLAMVARCAWLRRSFSPSRGTAQPPLPPNKGIKKKALQSLPKTSFDATVAAGEDPHAECVICLVEFVRGDEIRILPHCGHGFHAACIDTWLGSHSSCPSCRRILIVSPPSRCDLCGARSASGASSADGPAVTMSIGCKSREEGGPNRFLP